MHQYFSNILLQIIYTNNVPTSFLLNIVLNNIVFNVSFSFNYVHNTHITDECARHTNAAGASLWLDAFYEQLHEK